MTTACLALTLTWPRPCLLAECDPAGGTVQAGYLAGALPPGRGIGELAVAALRGRPLAGVWWSQLVDLRPPGRRHLLLPGITDPAQAAALDPVWDQIAYLFTAIGGRTEGSGIAFDVVADCGRLVAPCPPWPVLAAADCVLLATPATLPGLAAAIPVVGMLRARLARHGGDRRRVGLLLCGRCDQSPGTAARVLDTTVVAQLPHDPRCARVLTHGGTVRHTAPLLRAAADSYRPITSHAARHSRPAPTAEVVAR